MRPRSAALALLTAALVAGSLPASASVRQLDPTFGGDGWVTRARPDTGNVVDVLPRPEGQIVTAVDGLNGWMLQAYTDAGEPDPSFGHQDGTVTVRAIAAGSIASLTARPDGGFIAAGTTMIGDGVDFHIDLTIVAFRPNGAIDHSFAKDGIFTYGEGTAADEYPSSVTILPDGSILVTISAGARSPTPFAKILRLLPDGTRDPSFGKNGIVSAASLSNLTLLQPHSTHNGRLVFAGFENPNGALVRLVAVRLTKRGTLDATFGTAGVITSDPVGYGPAAVQMVRDQGGWVACIMHGTSDQNTRWDLYTARITTAGTIDPAFGSGTSAVPIGSVPNGFQLASMTRDGDGTTIAGSIFDGTGEQDFNLFHVMPDGSIDATYGGASELLTLDRGFREYPSVIVADQQQRLVVGGQGYRANGRFGPLIARLSP